MTGYRGRIARSLVNARESADVSQRELAERLGRDKRTVQKWESGEMKISMEDFLEIFDALHVAVEPYSKWIRHPELFPNGLADINKFNHDKRRSALVHYYGRICVLILRFTAQSASSWGTTARHGWRRCRSAA